MKKIFVSLSLAVTSFVPAVHAQKVGDAVTPFALQKLEWVQGEAPTAWEPGKLYVLECWATWCGPCIAAIPHVDALYDKYASQGLRVIGVNVWEDGKDKVIDFVKKKGDGMSYPVAYTGKGGVFETEWLKVAEVQGIPHAFLVKDGKVLAMSHPAQLTEELIETLLKGGPEADAVLEKLNGNAKQQQAVGKAKAAWTAASKSKDPVAMKAAADQLEEVSPGDMYVPLFRVETLVVAQDWDGLEKMIGSLDETNKMRGLIIRSAASSLAKTEAVPRSTNLKLIAAYQTLASESARPMPFDPMSLSRLYWLTDDKAKALEEAKKAVTIAQGGSTLIPVPAEPFQKFAAAVEGGSMPSVEDFNGWMKESRDAAKATAKPAEEGK